MAVWTYDGDFNGFLCLIHKTALAGESPDGIYPEEKKGQSLFFSPRRVRTNGHLAVAVRKALSARMSQRTLSTGYYAFLSTQKDKEMKVYRYYSLGWSMGREVDRLLTDKRVQPVHEARLTVLRERHRFLGLLRFTDLGGVLYAPFEPEGNILPLLAGHFSSRLGREQWIIHDRGRNKAAVFTSPLWRITDFRLPEGISPSKREQAFQDLWKRYFSAITVNSRIKPTLQRQFMPKKYWKYLPEKESPPVTE